MRRQTTQNIVTHPFPCPYRWHLFPVPPNHQKLLYVTSFPPALQNSETVTCNTFSSLLPNIWHRCTWHFLSLFLPDPRNRYRWHPFPLLYKHQTPLHVTPFPFPSKLLKPFHVTAFPSSSQTPETVTCGTLSFLLQDPKTVTCDTFSFFLSDPRHRYMWHLFPAPPRPQNPFHVTSFFFFHSKAMQNKAIQSSEKQSKAKTCNAHQCTFPPSLTCDTFSPCRGETHLRALFYLTPLEDIAPHIGPYSICFRGSTICVSFRKVFEICKLFVLIWLISIIILWSLFDCMLIFLDFLKQLCVHVCFYMHFHIHFIPLL